jgi:hypothetical protein
MSITHRLGRSAALCGLVCAALVTVTAGVALAAPDERQLHAQERSYSTYGTADTSRALAQEQYLGSYGEPQTLTPPASPSPSGDTPWLPIVLSIGGALVIVAASATQLRRLRVRRRRAYGSAA